MISSNPLGKQDRSPRISGWRVIAAGRNFPRRNARAIEMGSSRRQETIHEVAAAREQARYKGKKIPIPDSITGLGVFVGDVAVPQLDAE